MDEILKKLDRSYTKLQELQLAPTVHNTTILTLAYQDLKDAYAFVKKMKDEQAAKEAEEAEKTQAEQKTEEAEKEAAANE